MTNKPFKTATFKTEYSAQAYAWYLEHNGYSTSYHYNATVDKWFVDYVK